MEEAVEICKLRLFLKLVAQLENYDQIEPLPDIDFNIRDKPFKLASRGSNLRTKKELRVLRLAAYPESDAPLSPVRRIEKGSKSP